VTARRRWAGLVTAASLLAAGTGCAADAGAVTADEPLLIAGAADLRPAFEELGRMFEAATGERVVFSFGSSGQLAQQLIEGAPMDLYASANVAYVEQVLAAGVGDPASQATYAIGRMVLWSPTAAWGGWDDLTALAADDGVRTIAIANPDHAPYGAAAAQALDAAGVAETVAPKLVYGENVADTQRLAASGNADVAIVALSLALASDEAGEGRWTLLDDALHEPLQQDLLVVAEDDDRAALARRFVDHVGTEEGRTVMRRFGFVLPGEDLPDGARSGAPATSSPGG
jgi:molybdate transport system substrate-binding protein